MAACIIFAEAVREAEGPTHGKGRFVAIDLDLLLQVGLIGVIVSESL
jgi:hypothetical protein